MTRQVLAIVGVLAGAGVAAGAWADHRGRGGHPQRLDVDGVKEELGLSDAQVDQVKKLRSEQRKAGIRRRADIEVARIELHDLLEAPTVDEKAVSAKVRELSDLEAAALRAHVDSRLALRKTLTAEQHRKIEGLRRHKGAGARHRRSDAGGDNGADEAASEPDGALTESGGR